MIKFVLLGAVVLLAIWLLRGARGRGAPSAPPPAEPAKPVSGEEMVVCRHCGVHLPHSEALPGRGGLFCGEAHRLEHERSHPAP